ADEAVEVKRGVKRAAVEEIFLRILGGDEAKAAIGDDLLDGTDGHEDLKTTSRTGEGRTHGPFEKEIDHAEGRRESRRSPSIAQMFEDPGRFPEQDRPTLSREAPWGSVAHAERH